MIALVHGAQAALDILAACGAQMSRQNFYQSVLPHLRKHGFARSIGEGKRAVLEIDRHYLQHWGRYIAEVRRRKNAGELPGDYEFSESDMQNFIEGAWE